MDIKILDCTLRDGSHVNKGEFGKEGIKGIIQSLTEAGLDFIELGFLKNGVFTADQSFATTPDKMAEYLPETSNSRFSMMIRPDWYDIEQLKNKNPRIDLLRFAFYLKDKELTRRQCQIVKDFGYQVALNPVNVISYTEKELLELIRFANEIQPYTMTIVDTFGSLTFKKLKEVYTLIEENLDKTIAIGLHLHDNMLMAFALMQHFLSICSQERKVIIDGSLDGMGRIPGNLTIEMLADFINSEYGKNYDIRPLLYAISRWIYPIKKEIPWGYSPIYYLTGKMGIHRSYGEYFLKKEGNMQIIKELLEKMDAEKYQVYDEKYAEKLYLKLGKDV